jgi:tRNA(fMet)-specific endonuclease VapC
MIVLDTDSYSILERGGAAALPLELRLAGIPPEEVCTTVITYEEQMRGWLALAAQAKTKERLTSVYSRLQYHIESYKKVPLLGFDGSSADIYERLRKEHRRAGAMDLRIAAIAIANDATLITRNLRDFEGIEGLRVEDWTSPPRS